MSQKLNCVMLIDDDEDDNFFHKIVLEESGVTGKIEIAESAEQALASLLAKELTPELIFLDLNMPRINGFEFLQELAAIKLEFKPVIVLLTTSAYPFNKENTIQEYISATETKPLTAEKLKPVIKKYFNIDL